MILVEGREVLSTIDEIVDPRRTALIMIDVQNDFARPGGLVDQVWQQDFKDMQAKVADIAQALAYARRAGVRPIYVQHTVMPHHITHSGPRIRSTTRGLRRPVDKYGCIEGTPGWEICAEVRPLPTDIVVRKIRASAFVGTDLDLLLRSYGIESVVLTGFLTEGCVLATAQDAICYDYYTVIAADCVATSNPELHRSLVRYYEKRFDVVTLGDLDGLWTPKAEGH